MVRSPREPSSSPPASDLEGIFSSSIVPEARKRHRFVLAVFQDSAGPGRAISDLLCGEFRDSQLLVIANELQDRRPPLPAPPGAEAVRNCRINLNEHGDGDQALRSAVPETSPFWVLWENVCAKADGHDISSKGPSVRIFERLRKHLSDGAVVLIVSAGSAEQQTSAARALLDNRCELLLTHEVSVEGAAP